MLVAAAVCPQPPLLVPAVAQGASAELDDLRHACDAAISGLLAAAPDRVVVLTSGAEQREVDGGIADLGPYAPTLGVASTPSARLSLGLTIGAWLLDRNGVTVQRTYVTTRGGRVRLPPGRVALLVLADGTARRGDLAPGSAGPRADLFDQAVATALETWEPSSLERLDPALAGELWAGGVPALRAIGATAPAAPSEAALLYDAAPYGVGYWVALWRFADAAVGAS